MRLTAVPFSDLVRKPVATVAKLEESPRRRIRLDRRDGDDLILESAERAEAEDEALNMASRLFFSLVQNDEGARALLLALPALAAPRLRRTSSSRAWHRTAG